MTKNRLQSMTVSDLNKLAAQQGIIISDDMDKDDLIDAIIDAFEESRLERTEDDNWTIKSETKKFEIFRDEVVSIEKSPSIHQRFNESKIGVILVNPLMAFVFWEFGEDKKELALKCAKRNNLLLRVHEKGLDDDSVSFFDIPVKYDDSKWYITLPSNGCQYYIDLIMRNPEENVIATSNKIESPRKITKDVVNNESMNRDDFLVLAGVYGFYDDEDGSGDNTQKIVSFLNTGSIGEGD